MPIEVAEKGPTECVDYFLEVPSVGSDFFLGAIQMGAVFRRVLHSF